MPNRFFRLHTLTKLTFISLLFISFACASKPEHTIKSILELEQKLQQLKSEINITNPSPANTDISNNMAPYYIKKKSWLKSFHAVKNMSVSKHSEKENYQHILYGISLQKLNKKNSAIKYYNTVPKNSYYYANAQLNLALLHMHDGHINKAIVTIHQVLSDSSININKPLKNKILLTLGYLYFKDNKFRLARNTFGKINKKTTHFNKALLGIALTASELNDPTAAQHILSILKNSQYFDLAADEAFILTGYTYESINNYAKAAMAYQEAIDHYIKRTRNIKNLLQDAPIKIKKILNRHIFFLSDNRIDLSNTIPASFFDHYEMSKKLLTSIAELYGTENNLYKRSARLHNEYNKIIKTLLISHLDNRHKILLDYLNQSRYRLAVSSDKSSLN